MQVPENAKQILTPPRHQDQISLMITHCSDGSKAMNVSAVRVHIRDAMGNELPAPMGEPLPEMEAYNTIIEVLQARLMRAIKEAPSQPGEQPAHKGLVLTGK